MTRYGALNEVFVDKEKYFLTVQQIFNLWQSNENAILCSRTQDKNKLRQTEHQIIVIHKI